MSLNEQRLINEAEVALLDQVVEQQLEVDFSYRYDVQRLSETMRANEAAAKAVMRRLMSDGELRRIGHITAPPLAEVVELVWDSDPDFVVEVYDRLFSHHETDEAGTPLINDIFIFQMSRSQLYGTALGHLEQKFAAFLEAQPQHATQAMLRVLDQLHSQQRRSQRRPQVLEVPQADGTVSKIALDDDPWTEYFVTSSGHPLDFLSHWCNFLITLADKEEGDHIWQQIAVLALCLSARSFTLRHVLQAGVKRPKFYAPRLWQFLAEPAMLVRGSGHIVGPCLQAFEPFLTVGQLEHIQIAVLEAPEAPADAESESSSALSRWDKKHLLEAIPASRRLPAVQVLTDALDAEYKAIQESWAKEEAGQPLPFLPASLKNASQAPSSLTAPRNSYDIRDAALYERFRRLEKAAASVEGAPDVAAVLELHEETEQSLGATEHLGTQTMVRDEMMSLLATVAASGHAAAEPWRSRLMVHFLPLAAPSEEDFMRACLEARAGYEKGWRLLRGRRTKAARGFAFLITTSGELSEEEKAVLNNLAHDTRARVEVAEVFWPLLRQWPDLAWSYLEGWVAELDGQEHTDNAVILALQLEDSLARLRAANAMRADQLLVSLTEKAVANQAVRLVEPLGEQVAGLAWLGDVPAAQAYLDRALADVPRYVDLLKGATTVALRLYVPFKLRRFAGVPNCENQEAASDPFDAPKDGRRRALEFLLRLVPACQDVVLASAQERLRLKEQQSQDPSTVGDEGSERPEWIRTTTWLMEYLSGQVENHVEDRTRKWQLVPPSTQQMAALWQRIEPLLEVLLQPPALPLSHILHSLLKAVGAIAPHDPRRALDWIDRLTAHGASWKAQHGHSVAQEAVKALQAILNGLGSQLASSEAFCRTLDAYIQTGHLEAHHLAFQFSSMVADDRGNPLLQRASTYDPPLRA